MEAGDRTCALCGSPVGGAGPAHAVRDKFICDECRGLVLAAGPRPVLPYAGGAGGRRRWLWAFLALGVVIAGMATSLLVYTVQRAAVERARAEQMRALAAQRQVMAEALAARAIAEADAARASLAQTRPAE